MKKHVATIEISYDPELEENKHEVHFATDNGMRCDAEGLAVIAKHMQALQDELNGIQGDAK